MNTCAGYTRYIPLGMVGRRLFGCRRWAAGGRGLCGWCGRGGSRGGSRGQAGWRGGLWSTWWLMPRTCRPTLGIRVWRSIDAISRGERRRATLETKLAVGGIHCDHAHGQAAEGQRPSVRRETVKYGTSRCPSSCLIGVAGHEVEEIAGA